MINRDRRRSSSNSPNRNGVAIVLVMGVIAMTLAMSYALMRTQFTTTQVQENATRHGDARQAAVAGISHAIRVMHDSDEWEGVDSMIEGALSSSLRYSVTYTAGDPSLEPANAASYPNREYDKYPYRITLDATGYALDPDDDSRETSHKIRVVMQLVPRQLSTSEPANWPAINQYTVYQWHTDKDVKVELPVRIEGAAYLQGKLELAEDYPYDAKPFDGVIDEVAIFDYALSAEQLLTIYENALGIDGGVAEEAVSVNADALGAALAARSPAHWWRMNESAGSTTIADSAGSAVGTWEGVHQTANGATGSTGNGAAFRGRHDAINLGTLNITSPTMTICGWFKADRFNYSDARIISKATSTANDDHYWMLSTFKYNGAMRLRFRLKTNHSTSTLYGTGGSFSTGEWVFAAAVYDGTMMRLFQNGIEVGSMAKTGVINTSNFVYTFIGDNPPGSSRARYLVDLERMRVDGLGDDRPFTGPLSLGTGKTDDDTISLLADEMSTTVDATVAANTSAPLTHPGAVTQYQLYTGGPVYAVPQMPSSIADQTLAPDPIVNPLGVYRDSGQDTCIYADTSVQGVLLFDGSSNDVKIKGSNVTLSSVELLPLDDGTVYELPVITTEGDFLYDSTGGGTIDGMVLAWDKMCLEPGYNQTLSVTGRVVARELHMRGPEHWSWLTESQWNTLIYYFRIWDTYFDSEIAAMYFPEFLKHWKDYAYNDRLTVKADDASPNYHWHDWQNPIIVPHSDDPGLRWDLIEWIDNPITD